MADKTAYILVRYAPQVEGYLGFGGRVEVVRGDFALVAVPRDYARWQLGRLASGGYVVPPGLFEDRSGAMSALEERV